VASTQLTSGIKAQGSAPPQNGLYCVFHLRVASRAALRLDDAEKHRFRELVCRSSAWVPVTHASVTPLRDVFQTAASRVARSRAGASTPHASEKML
jgi:hypothetical protein